MKLDIKGFVMLQSKSDFQVEIYRKFFYVSECVVNGKNRIEYILQILPRHNP